jgi:TPR repeat protein
VQSNSSTPNIDERSGSRVSIAMTKQADDVKVAGDQGDAVAQYNCGICLWRDEGFSKDLKGAAHYFKLSADHKYAVAQYNYGIRLKNGEGVSQDLIKTIYYFDITANQGDAELQYHSGICPLADLPINRNIVDE